MKLEEWKKEKGDFTSKLSEVNRYLCFAGIGIIWIFKYEIEKEYNIPHDLLLPLILFALSLGFDFLQYLYSAVVWTCFFKYHEKQKWLHPDKDMYKKDDIKVRPIIPGISFYCLFLPKVILNIIGYIYLLTFLFNTFFK
jgi:hypothetical protein